VQALSAFAVVGAAVGIDVRRCDARFFAEDGQALDGRLITAGEGGLLKAVFDCPPQTTVVYVYLRTRKAPRSSNWSPATGLLWETRGCRPEDTESIVSATAFRNAWERAAGQRVEAHAVPSPLINHLFEHATDGAYLCRVEGALHIAKSGEYEFSTIATSGRAFLSIDGKLTSTFDAARGDDQLNSLPFDYPAGRKGKPRVVTKTLLESRWMRRAKLVNSGMQVGDLWQNPKWRKGRSGTVKLEAGLHRIELLRVAPRSGSRGVERYGPLYCAATWVPPGAGTHDGRRDRRDPPIPATAFAPFASFRAVATERKDGDPVAAMTWRRASDYRHGSHWRNSRHVLTLTTFRALTAGLDRWARFHWSFDDGGVAEGRDISHVFASPGLHRVGLEVRDGDRLLAKTTAHCHVDLCYDKDHDWVDAQLRPAFNSAVVHEPFERTPIPQLERLCRFAEAAGETKWQRHLQRCVARRAGDLFPDHWAFGMDLGAAMMRPEFSNHELAYTVYQAALKRLPSDHPGRTTARVLSAAYLIRVVGRMEDGLEALAPVSVLDLTGQWHVYCVPGKPLITPPRRRDPKGFKYHLPEEAPAIHDTVGTDLAELERGTVAWPAVLSAEERGRLRLTDKESARNVCFVKRFRGPEHFRGKALALCLGRPRDHCAVYLNGTLVGGGGTASTPGKLGDAGLVLPVPKQALEFGKENELIVRVGFWGRDKDFGIESQAISLNPTGTSLDTEYVSLAHNLRVEALLALGREQEARDYLDIDAKRTESAHQPQAAVTDYRAQLNASLQAKARLEHVRSLLKDGEAKAAGRKLSGDTAYIPVSEFYKKALGELKQALGSDPSLRFKPDYQLLHARVLIARREHLRALFTLDGLLNTESPFMQQRPEALAEKVRVLTLLHRFKEARTLYEEMLAEPGMKYQAAMASAAAHLQAAALRRSTVKLDPPPGIYRTPPTVKLSVDNLAARIRYTFGDMDPSAYSSRYVIPIKVPRRGLNVLRTRAYVRNKPVGRVTSGAYDVLPDVADQPSPDLPLWAVAAMIDPRPSDPEADRKAARKRQKRNKKKRGKKTAPPRLTLSMATETFADRIVDDMAVRISLDISPKTPFTIPVPPDYRRFVALVVVDPLSAAEYTVSAIGAKDQSESLATGAVKRDGSEGVPYNARFATINVKVPPSATKLAIQTKRLCPRNRSIYLLHAGYARR